MCHKFQEGTVTGHYFNFIAKVIDILDRHPHFKNHYLIMDNVPIHANQDTKKLLTINVRKRENN